MLLAATSDLHFNYAPHQDGLERMVRAIRESPAEVLIVAGDFASGPFEEHYARWLPRIEFSGPKLAVPGNHDVWQTGGSTWDRYRAVCDHLRDQGWHVLDDGPYRHRGVTFVGNMGWYDYSFYPEATSDTEFLFRSS